MRQDLQADCARLLVSASLAGRVEQGLIFCFGNNRLVQVDTDDDGAGCGDGQSIARNAADGPPQVHRSGLQLSDTSVLVHDSASITNDVAILVECIAKSFDTVRGVSLHFVQLCRLKDTARQEFVAFVAFRLLFFRAVVVAG
ncbi:hypothetical protein D3C72_1771640 [compost metagenome]